MAHLSVAGTNTVRRIRGIVLLGDLFDLFESREVSVRIGQT